ncbi:MAG TPA: hypothetical protein VM884_05350 [Flavisolibacter sp.]|nr:hypothetical protein [Flavisolibacter sp.]
MKVLVLYATACTLLFCSCNKESGSENLSTSTPATSFKQFVIPQGEHYATENGLKPLEIAELKFVVKFDSSAIYQTTNPENQYDINKLYGFADNSEPHHLYSARFGWRWSDGALRLFAYTYNRGVRDSKELGTVAIGKEMECSIKVAGEVYLFSLEGKTETMARLSTTPTAKGYQLYPYFGGDEVAPHQVKIWIREVK